MITTDDLTPRAFQLLTFPAPTSGPQAILPRALDAQRVQAILDRLQGLALARPRLAESMLDWNERTLTRWEGYIEEGRW